METSAKAQINVEEVFVMIARSILKRLINAERDQKAQGGKGIELKRGDGEESKSKCCR